MDNVPQLSAVVEYALGGGASTELQELMPGKKWIIFQTCLDRDWRGFKYNDLVSHKKFKFLEHVSSASLSRHQNIPHVHTFN